MQSQLLARVLGIVLVSLILLPIMPMHLIISVRAASSPTLLISPLSQPLASPGITITFQVNVSNVSPASPVAGWAIYVETNSNVLDPVSIALGSFLAGAQESTECINNLCNVGSPAADDGPGVVHSEAFTGGSGSYGNGTLFTISYNAVAGPYTFVTFLSPMAKTQLIDTNGIPIFVTTVDGAYGNVPALPVANFNYSPQQPFAGDRVTFNATSSSAPLGQSLVDYLWTFTEIPTTVPPVNTRGVITSRIFDAGNWTATLVVKDDRGISSRPTTLSLGVAVKPSTDLSLSGGLSVFPIDNILPDTIVTLKVYVIDLGTTFETRFNVSVSVAGQTFTAPPYANVLAPRQQASFTFLWNTTGVAPDSYTVHAHVDSLVGENNTANNEGFATLRVIYPFQGAPIPLPFLQLLGLTLLALVTLGFVISFLRRVRNRRLMAQRDLL